VASKAAMLKSSRGKGLDRYVRRVNAKLRIFQLELDGIGLNIVLKRNTTMADFTNNTLFDQVPMTHADGTLNRFIRPYLVWTPVLYKDLTTLIKTMVTLIGAQNELVI
jgi:hypothetical protein